MAENVHNDNLLIRYLDGELTPEERAALEARLGSDKSLREQLTDLQVAVQAVKHLGTTEQVSAIHADMMKELKAQPKAKVIAMPKALRYSLSVAASILVLFVGIRLYQSSQISPERLYDDAFVDFNSAASRSAAGGLSTIEQHYQQKAYDAVIADQRSTQLNAKDSLLTGLAYMQTGRFAQAIGFFQAIANASGDYRPDAEFYLALGHLKNKDYARALGLLQKIAGDPAHLYHSQVDEELLAGVKKLSEK